MTIEVASQDTVGTFVPPPPPRTPKAAATRRLLLDVACRLFIAQGYSAVSIRDLAGDAGLTKGALYGHFRSKGQLLVEVIRSKLAELDQSIDFVEARANPDAGVELMHHEAGRDIRLLQVDAAAAARHDPDVAAGLGELYRERHDRIRDAAYELDDPDTAAWVISALTAGIGALESFGPRPDARRLNTILVAALTNLPQRSSR